MLRGLKFQRLFAMIAKCLRLSTGSHTGFSGGKTVFRVPSGTTSGMKDGPYMNMEMLWDKTCALLLQEMPYVSYNTWVEGNLAPVSLEGDCLYLSLAMENMRGMIQKRYGILIDRCLTEAAGRPMRAEILTREEMEAHRAGTEEGADGKGSHLNPQYTFESFVVGEGNRFAHATSLAVAENPAEAYNPLFIYGGVGLGKTHLMQAIGHFVHQADQEKKILYMTSETFTNELINSIQQKKTYEFRERIRQADVLLVDDIQFIAGRESTQQEFFNIFNELHNANKQIVLTSDKQPKEIQRLEERLVSRFEWGLVADIQRPDIDTRVAILREKTQQKRIDVPDEVLQLIAGKIDSNIRELEGCLARLVAYAKLVRQPITTELCETALKEIFDQQQHRQITAELIMRTVTDYYGLSMDSLTSDSRRREITVPRQIAMYLTREMTGMSLPRIGSVFGGRDHTTVMHSCKTVEANMKTNAGVKSVVEDIQRLVRDSR